MEKLKHQTIRIFKEEIFQKKNLLILSFMLLQSFTLVLHKKVSIKMENYPYILTLFQPCCTTTLFGILALLQARFNFLKQDENTDSESEGEVKEYSLLSLEASGPIEDQIETRINETGELRGYMQSDLTLVSPPQAASKVRLTVGYMIMGVLFTVVNLLLFSGSRGKYVPGPIIVLLQQIVIPLTILFSIAFLSTRYKLSHYAGAFLIISGVIISLIPEFESRGKFVPILLIILSTIPSAAVIIYMEHSLKTKNAEIFTMWTWINVAEALFAVPLVFLIIPIQGISISHIPSYISNGFSCLFADQNSEENDQCHNTLGTFSLFIFILVATKVNLALVVKANSATLLWLASTGAIPIAAIFFSFSFVMGSNATPFSFFLFFGIVLVVLGLILFKATQPVKKTVTLEDSEAFSLNDE